MLFVSKAKMLILVFINGNGAGLNLQKDMTESTVYIKKWGENRQKETKKKQKQDNSVRRKLS